MSTVSSHSHAAGHCKYGKARWEPGVMVTSHACQAGLFSRFGTATQMTQAHCSLEQRGGLV